MLSGRSPSISACLIVKNEAHFLPDCLRSIGRQVDEIVLVDTGSVDDTVSIAKSFDCRIFHFDWVDDFSKARNYGLDQATGEWVLYIDADERLNISTAGGLKQALADVDAIAARIKFRSSPKVTPYAEYRLFRNDVRLRFTGSMHETNVPGIFDAVERDGAKIVDRFDVSILHLGYEGDQSAKHERNLPLLEAAIRDDPDRVFLRLHLGSVLGALGRRQDAVRQLTRGIELAERPQAPEQARVEGSACAKVLCDFFLDTGDLAYAVEFAGRGLSLFGENLQLHWMQARCLVAAGSYEDAIEILNGPLNQRYDEFFDPKIAYDHRLFREDRFGLLGSAWFRLAEYQKAADCFARASSEAEDGREYEAKASVARMRLTTAG
ncbi:glycosyltransferase [Hoeflea prorocentri]|uniref:Glycosyltransferase n=1 Tax=Hoeflea prorocentri TaxID=1922333 RepID=A0A9X3UGK1_9HYPH|nr:TPR domain-containing glycosyltransferase [Hoeflea prorocentri]MCY6380229.1 glycosyltransferase [Hoeflea prorocentri]MDA5398029.1 glycosyltransferase [Hoeflea prorocentri]